MVVKYSPQWDYHFQSCVIRLIHFQNSQSKLHCIKIYRWYYFTEIKFQAHHCHIIYCDLKGMSNILDSPVKSNMYGNKRSYLELAELGIKGVVH